MARIFARLFAIILAVAVFVLGLVLLAQLRPMSVGGWAFMAFGAASVLVAPFLVYRSIMGRFRETPFPNEGEGAGLAMGTGIDRARREDDGDVLDFD
jgi:phosphoglycerol transferase MdoB-like AlkP superfamily enzyme